MRKFILLLFSLSLVQTAQADLCSEIQTQMNIGGVALDIQSIQSSKIKVLFQKILLSAHSNVLTPACNGSALIDSSVAGSESDQYAGVFLIKGDAFSSALVREYKVSGQFMFDVEGTKRFGLTLEEYSLSNTLMLDSVLVPERIPALVDSTLLFASYYKVKDEVYTMLTTVIVDKDTHEAIVWNSKYSQ